MKVHVTVTLKKGVLDPQGKAIQNAMESMGFDGVNNVRAGKLIELDLDDNVSDDQIEDICSKLLANMVIEDFSFARVAGTQKS